MSSTPRVKPNYRLDVINGPLVVPRSIRISKPSDVNIRVRAMTEKQGEAEVIRAALRAGFEALGWGDIDALA